MKIIYHHYNDPLKEKYDKIHDWWTVPPELITTKEEREKLIKWWHFFCGENAYVTDPLGATQCDYYIYKQIPRIFRLFLFGFVEKKHMYDVYDEKATNTV